MNDRKRFIELNYYYHGEFNTPEEVIRKHQPSNLFVPFLAKKMDIILVKHLNYEGALSLQGVDYRFFKSSNGFFHIPSAVHRFIKKSNPSIVLVQGLIFPLQVIALGMKLGKGCKIVLQHQGEVPFRKKKILQKIADRYVDGYIFTSLGNAEEWIDAGIIKDRKKCYEIIPSSTEFTKQDKTISKEKLGMKAAVNFLWVGRLNANKDPFTVLRAFEKYFINNPFHKLYMIYGDDNLLEPIKKMLSENPLLNKCVELIGEVPHLQLETWYSAADYFVSGSHREGGSYALTEAMACGCIPVVTAIPSAMKAISSGQAGHHYKTGDPAALYQLLSGLDHQKKDAMSLIVQNHFKQYFSPSAIADKMYDLYQDLNSK